MPTCKKLIFVIMGIFGLLTSLSSIITRNDSSYAIPAFFLGLMGGAIYLIPSIIAAYRNHQNVVAILTLNVLGGWTVLGWVGSIVWAVLTVKANQNYSSTETSKWGNTVMDHKRPEHISSMPSNAKLTLTDTCKCPFCAETIKSEAIFCRFCQKDINSQSN